MGQRYNFSQKNRKQQINITLATATAEQIPYLLHYVKLTRDAQAANKYASIPNHLERTNGWAINPRSPTITTSCCRYGVRLKK